MVKVLMERTIRGQNVAKSCACCANFGFWPCSSPAISAARPCMGWTTPTITWVISTWESLKQWQDWFNNPERQKLSAEIDGYLESATRTRVMTN